ncbi:MAG: hypothetical protein LBI14_03975 [Treponema sp.]|jgi:hypothetical protein|nr:hypothetical protein [Treponema sp.]
MMKGFFSSCILLRLIFAILMCTVAIFPLKAQDRLSWFAEGSVLFFPEANGNLSDPMPILPSLGAGLGLPIFNHFRLEISLDMYFAIYGYDDGLNRAVPMAWENRSAFVWGSVLGAQGVYFHDFYPGFLEGRAMTLRVFGGLAADLRIVLLAPDLKPAVNPNLAEIKQEVSAVAKYFWSKGRWLLPVFGSGLDFELNTKFRLGLDLRVWFPLYKLWTNENLPGIEGWRFGIGARITFL